MDASAGGTSGEPLIIEGGIPCMIILKPKEKNANGEWESIEEINVEDRDSIRLWTVNNMNQFFLAEDIDSEWGKPFSTNYDGCLVKRDEKKKKLLWAVPKSIKQNAYYYHFTTIPLLRENFKETCRTFCSRTNITAEKKYKSVKRPYEDPEETITKPYIFFIDSEFITQKSNIGKLCYWETVMFEESSDKNIEAFHTKQDQKKFTENDFNALRKLLATMRGDLVVSLISDEKEGNVIELGKNYSQTPARLYDYDVGRSGRIGPDNGPYWIICESYDVKAEVPEYEGKSRIYIYKMSKSDTTNKIEFTLPNSHVFLPPIDHEIIDWIEKETKEIFKSFSLGEGGLTESSIIEAVKKKIKESKRSNNGPNDFLTWEIYRNNADFISKFFYISLHNNFDVRIILALDGAAKHWKCHSESQFLDIMEEKKDNYTEISIESSVILGYATKSDAFSESITPKHVYFQLKEWWENLCETDINEIKDSEKIEIWGYSSRLGGKLSEYNLALRKNRAWRAAKSLELLLKRHGNLKKTIRIIESSQINSISSSELPIIYNLGEKGIFPSTDLPYLFSPVGAAICDLHIEDNVNNSAVKQVDLENDPRDRISLIIFTRKLPRGETQYVVEKSNFNAAHVLSSYRVIHDMNNRMLLYAIPGTWGKNIVKKGS